MIQERKLSDLIDPDYEISNSSGLVCKASELKMGLMDRVNIKDEVWTCVMPGGYDRITLIRITDV